MRKYLGIPGPWECHESWMEDHVCIGSEKHMAFAHVLTQMEEKTTPEKKKQLEATLELIVNAPKILDLLQLALPYLKDSARTSGHAWGVYNMAKKAVDNLTEGNNGD